jgi:hypothetical protein
MRKLALSLLLLCSLCFAAGPWQAYAGFAILISATMLAAVYMIGVGFDVREIKFLVKDEAVQLGVLVVLMIALMASDGILNAISTSTLFARGEANMQDAALVSLNNTIDDLSSYLLEVQQADKKMSKESSRTSSCVLSGGGHSVSACGGYSMLATPLSMSGSILGYAIAQAAAVQKLIMIAQEFVFVLILPLGIVLRTFKFTRGAGGLLIALGIGLYIFVPAGIVFTEVLQEKFEYAVTADPDTPASWKAGADPYLDPPGDIDVEECDAGQPWGNVGAEAVSAYNDMKHELKGYMYVFMIKATLGPVLSLLMFIGGLRAMTALFGAPVDVSAIARFF